MTQTRTERRKAEVRERILVAAYDLFLERGPAARIDDVCERADIASRTFFNHFPTRQDLLGELARQRLANFRLILLDREDTPVPQRLVDFLDDVARTLAAQGAGYRELIAAMLEQSGEGAERGSVIHGAVTELLARGVARCEVRADVPLPTLADIVAASVITGVLNWTREDTYDLATLAQTLAGLVAAG